MAGLEGIFGGSGARVTAAFFFGGSGVTPAPGSGSGVFLEGVVTPSRPGSGVAICGQGRFHACCLVTGLLSAYWIGHKHAVVPLTELFCTGVSLSQSQWPNGWLPRWWRPFPVTQSKGGRATAAKLPPTRLPAHVGFLVSHTTSSDPNLAHLLCHEPHQTRFHIKLIYMYMDLFGGPKRTYDYRTYA